MHKINRAIVFLTMFLALPVTADIISNGFHYSYHAYADDEKFMSVYEKFGLFGGAGFIIHHENGRWVSNCLLMLLQPLFRQGRAVVAAFFLFNYAIFVLALSYFLRSFFDRRYQIPLNFSQGIFAAILFYGFFFIFSFDKRVEFWFFPSAIFAYQYSLILIFILIAVLLKKKYSAGLRAIAIIISCCLGLMGEAQAIAAIFIVFMLVIGEYINERKFDSLKFLSMLLIALSLVANYFSDGNQRKMAVFSKTEISASVIHKAILISLNDLAFNWPVISFRVFPIHQVQAWVVNIIVLIALFMLIRSYLNSSGSNSRLVAIYSWQFWWVVIVALGVLAITWFVTAMLYANISNVITDRCKMMAEFAGFFAAFDFYMMVMPRMRKSAHST